MCLFAGGRGGGAQHQPLCLNIARGVWIFSTNIKEDNEMQPKGLIKSRSCCCTCAADSHGISGAEMLPDSEFKQERSRIPHEGLKQTSRVRTDGRVDGTRSGGGNNNGRPGKTCVACVSRHFCPAARKETAHFADRRSARQHNTPTCLSGERGGGGGECRVRWG